MPSLVELRERYRKVRLELGAIAPPRLVRLPVPRPLATLVYAPADAPAPQTDAGRRIAGLLLEFERADEAMKAAEARRARLAMLLNKAQSDEERRARPERFAAHVQEIAGAYRISVRELMGMSKSHSFLPARLELYWLGVKDCGLSSTFVGRAMGDRDHTTVLHGCRRVERIFREAFGDIGAAVQDLPITERRAAITRAIRNGPLVAHGKALGAAQKRRARS